MLRNRSLGMDRSVSSFWIQNVYYYEDESKRYYLCHDNTFVYTAAGTKVELWRRKPGEDYYMIPIGNCEQVVKDNFLVADQGTSGRLMLNGKSVVGSGTGWFGGWVTSKFKLPDRYVVDGLFPLKIKPETNMGRNKIFFSVEALLSLDIYQRSRERILDIESKAKTMLITRKYLPFITALPEDFPRKKWRKEKINNIHFGQLKLLLAEIEFLTKIAPRDDPILILYPGGGPGDHVPLLSQMFPNVYFVLIDPVFETEVNTVKIVPDEKIIIRPELFTEEYISQIPRDNMAMISDIRSIPPSTFGPKGSRSYEQEFEKHAKFDMDLQQGWYKDLDGPASLLKFRLPYSPGDTKYLCGDLYLQAYPPELSTELRLIPRKQECLYSNTDIEEKMFYFNTEYRNQHFYDIHPFFGKTYDTLRQATILRAFLAWRGIENTDQNVFGMFSIIDNFFQRRRMTDYLLGRTF